MDPLIQAGHILLSAAGPGIPSEACRPARRGSTDGSRRRNGPRTSGRRYSAGPIPCQESGRYARGRERRNEPLSSPVPYGRTGAGSLPRPFRPPGNNPGRYPARRRYSDILSQRQFRCPVHVVSHSTPFLPLNIPFLKEPFNMASITSLTDLQIPGLRYAYRR